MPVDKTWRIVRGALLALGAAGALAAQGDGAVRVARQDAAQRPNILLIISDDQRWESFTRARMPNVFRELVDKGVLFTRAYVDTPHCCPSRAQILTGLYEHHTGVDNNPVKLPRSPVPRWQVAGAPGGPGGA